MGNIRNFTILLAILAGVSGCTGLRQWWHNGWKVGPNYAPPTAEVACDWKETDEEYLIPGSAVDVCWWGTFEDPQLNALIAMLHRQNLSLKEAMFRIEEARALRAVAAGNLFPQSQQMGASYARQGISKNTPLGGIPGFPTFVSNWDVNFNAAWELDFWGRFRRMVEAADANVGIKVYEYRAAVVLLQADLAATYIQYRTLEERIRLALRNVELQTRTINIIDARLAEGQVSELDLRQAKAELAITESYIPLLRAAHDVAENRICVLLGAPPMELAEMLGKTGVIPGPPPKAVIGIPAQLLTRRPDVCAVERALAAQSAKIGFAESDLYPHISIAGTIGWEAEEFAQLFDFNSTYGFISPGFRWNLLNYGRIVNTVRAEDARFCQLLWKYRQTVLDANREAEDALARYLREHVRLRSVAQSVSETERAVELALLLYSEGMADYQRVLDTQRNLVQQQDALAQSRGELSGYLILLYKALGGGWQCVGAEPPGSETPVGPPAPEPENTAFEAFERSLPKEPGGRVPLPPPPTSDPSGTNPPVAPEEVKTPPPAAPSTERLPTVAPPITPRQ